MTLAVLSQLAAATKVTATHPLAEYRFWSFVSLLSDLSLQNDDHGVMIAAEEAIAFMTNGQPATLEVQFVRDAHGDVVDIESAASFPSNNLVALAREVALLPSADHRVIILEAACLSLVQNKDWDGGDLLAAVEALSRGQGDVGSLNVSLPSDAMALVFPSSATLH